MAEAQQVEQSRAVRCGAVRGKMAARLSTPAPRSGWARQDAWDPSIIRGRAQTTPPLPFLCTDKRVLLSGPDTDAATFTYLCWCLTVLNPNSDIT